jgi:hypothetical protein
MVEWYWQGKIEVLGEKHYTAWVVDKWMWSNGGMILTGENWCTGRKALYGVDGRWMNVYGAMVEWYWQGKTDSLGDRSIPASFVHKQPTMTFPAAKPSLRDKESTDYPSDSWRGSFAAWLFPYNSQKYTLHLTEKHRVSIEAQVGQLRQENAVIRNQLTCSVGSTVHSISLTLHHVVHIVTIGL